jgi:tetratricopeptide (TPR) repeat protein
VDHARLEEAQRAFAAREWRTAAEAYLAAAGGPGGPGNGQCYHLAGNALMQLRKYHHAATVYQHALRDPGYPRLTAVLANLGTAQAALGDYADAVATFSAALGDTGYEKRYNLLQGRAGALHAMSRYEEAAQDYRSAASESANPDPGRALNNLGLSLAEGGRASEAVEAFKAAIGTASYDGKGKALANLGLTYAKLGRHAEAVAAFEASVEGYGHSLSEDALEALEVSKRATGASPQRETVDGWRTGEMRPVMPAAEDERPVEVPVTADDSHAVSEFFSRTDKEMKDLDREMRRKERDERRSASNPWARAAAVALLIVVVVGGSAAFFFAGYGYPTQQQTVSGMLDAYKAGRAVTDFWVAAPAGDVGKEMATIPPNFTYARVDKVERSAFSSKVQVTVKLEKGAPLRYRVSLSREGVGWKVVGIDNDWGTGGS